LIFDNHIRMMDKIFFKAFNIFMAGFIIAAIYTAIVERNMSAEPATYKYTNRLIYETGRYLLQHAHIPVDRHPRGAEAFDRAKREDKPIFISIGYSTCHCCHVIEYESFENECIAETMNEYFVSIKVDRQRPDVDGIYIPFRR